MYGYLVLLILMRAEGQVRKHKGTYRINPALGLHVRTKRGKMIPHLHIPEGKKEVGNCLEVKHGGSDGQIQVGSCPRELCCLYIPFVYSRCYAKPTAYAE